MLTQHHNMAGVARWVAAAFVCLLAAAVPTRAVQAQDACSAESFSVSPCVDAETHVSSGGTAEFTIYNYGYADDTYYVVPQCSGIVTGCQGRGYRYASAFSSITTDVRFSVRQQSGTGSVGADIASTYVGGEVEGAEAVYGQPLLVIDSAQTPVTTGDQNVGRCAMSCFTATASVSTVASFTLGEARKLTLVYNEDRAHPRPFIYATVSPAADGPQVSQYSFSATLNGSAVTFTNGEQTLKFLSPGNEPVRLGGQLALQVGSPAMYDLNVNVLVQYADGTSTIQSYATVLAVYDASNSTVARGWTIGEDQKLDCLWNQGCMVYKSDGSITVFLSSSYSGGKYHAADHSVLWWDGTHWQRQYLDQSLVQYDAGGFMTSYADPTGRQTLFGHDDGRLTDVVEQRKADGVSVPFFHLDYTANGLWRIREIGGPGADRVTPITVDNSRNLTRITDPDGHYTDFGYDAQNRLNVTYDRRGGAHQIGFDWASKMNVLVDQAVPIDQGNGSTALLNRWTYLTAWQSVGIPSSSTADSPPYATLARDVFAMVQDPGSHVTQFSVNSWGQPVTTYDPSGRRTDVAYSGKNPVSVTHDDWSEDIAQYDELDHAVMSKPAGDSATYYHYNAASQVDSLWGSAVAATGYHYNADNTLASMNDASGVSMYYSYNASKEVTSVMDNAGHQTTYGYDAVFMNQDTVVAPGGRTTTTVMDAYGRPSVINAPLMAAQTVVYDVMNRPQQVIQAGRPATVLTYDPLLRTDVQDANGNVTHTDYNALGWPVARRDASGATESFRYDIAGRMTSWTNRRGDVMTYTYDGNDRMISRSGRNIDDHYSYSRDGTVMVGWNNVEMDSVFHTSVAGNRLGADSTVTWVNGVRYRVLHGHAGALGMDDSTAISSSSGVGFQNRYVSVGTDGLVSQVRDGFNTAYPGYNDEALPNRLSNPSYGTRSADYTSLHQPSETSFSDGTLESTFGRSNHYDALGRVDLLNSLGAGTQHAYYYDQYGELTDDRISAGCYGAVVTPDEGANYANCTRGAGWTRYSYDAVGNRTDLGATYFVGNRLANFNGGFLTYDADGNVTQKYGVQPDPHNQLFYWNAESRLESVSYDGYYTVRYEYNAFGQPVKKYRQGALDRVWLWDGEQLLAEFDGNNQRVAEYQYSGLDQPYATTEGQYAPSSIQYPEQDALGNVLGTHTGTSVTERIEYDAWGVPSASGDLSSRLMWKGLLWEGDVVGLYYMR
ncbi:MAG: hypothetical protein ACR2GG_02035, partial [Gemmatimonadaceae bacterium]